MTVRMAGPTSAKVMLVGEWPHEADLRKGEPFVGGPGFELTKMLAEAGLYREQCVLTMAYKERVVGKLIAEKKSDVTPRHVLYQNKWVVPEVVEAARMLYKEIELVKPNIVCTLGNLGFWMLTGEWGVNSWRSSVMESNVLPGVKVVPTLSPGIVHAQWSQRTVIVHDLKRVKRESTFPEVKRRKYSRLIPTCFEEAYSTLEGLIKLADDGQLLKVGADIETRAGHISCISFAWSETDSICIPLMAVDKPEGYWNLLEESTLVWMMQKLMRRVTIVGQNWNYDAQYIFRHWHFLCPKTEDTMLKHHACFSNLPKNLAYLSAMYLEDHFYWKDDRTNWTTGPKGEGEIAYWEYCCTDSMRTLAINNVLDSVIKQLGPKIAAANKFQQDLSHRVLRAVNRGVRVDHSARTNLSFELMEEVATREKWLLDVLEQPLNIRSSPQMQDFFYRQMGMKEIINRKTKSVSCDDEALSKIASREPILLPVVRKIQELRSLGVFHSTFVQAGLDVDGRMRTSYNVAGTETYRFSSRQNAFGTGMNMQNVPKGGEIGDDGLELPNIRKLFIPDPGHTMFDIDLDSADLRIVTWESDCKWMKEQFRAGNKPYVEVMKEYYRDPTKNKHSPEYKIFKSLCHGTNYLGTADGIAPRIGLLVHETERIQKWYYEMCPEIKQWQDDIKAQVSGRRYVENAFGYRTYYLDKIEGTIFNQAVAWIPQSTVAILINHIWAELEDNPSTQFLEVLLQVHDSLVGQWQSHLGDWAMREMLKVANTVAVPYEDPLFIPVGAVTSDRSWGDCE